MSKNVGPLFSLSAHGTLSKFLTFQGLGNINILRKKPIPKNTRSICQVARRDVFLMGANTWKNNTSLVPETSKILWRAMAKGLPVNGYNLFMSAYIFLNLVNCAVVDPPIIPQPIGYTSGNFLITELGGIILLENDGSIELDL